MCPVCKDIERRFVFNNLDNEHCVATSPPIAPISENINKKEIADDIGTEAPSLAGRFG